MNEHHTERAACASPSLLSAQTPPRLRALALRWVTLAPLATCAVAAPVWALPQGESIDVSLRGSYIESIQSAGTTVPHEDLRPGISIAPITENALGGTPRTADGRNLESYFIRNNSPGAWEVRVPPNWTPGAGGAADFFIFEVGGNDAVTVRGRFTNGTTGAPVTLVGSWSPTDVVVDGGPNTGQRVHGRAFRFEDLRRANGAPVQSGDRLSAVIVESTGIDGASFLFREPGAFQGDDGDGSHVIFPALPRALSPVEVTFRGPWASETDEAPNPFLDFRLQVRFQGPGGRTFFVPGFFDAGGPGTDTGNFWVARFLPPVAGTWTASVDMRSGPGVAIDLNPGAGSPWSPLNGRSFQFNVAPQLAEAPGLFALGTLKNAGKHHWKFEFGPYYLKAGTNSPENFLALRAFDDATKSGGQGNLHSFEPHVGDWSQGDPLVDRANASDNGSGAIGALNYLADEGVNSLFLMLMNLGGDGNDVYPFLGPRNRSFEKLHYDTSRLRQWNTVLEHAQRKGITLSFVLNETEIQNEQWLDNGNLGTERRLFYREMIARFSHLPAVRWNLSEENDFPISLLNDFAAYIRALDPWDHAIAVHNHPNDLSLFQALVNSPNIDAASLQFEPNGANDQVELVRALTASSGKPWIVDADEMGPFQIGLTDSNAVDTRKRILYDALFSGGGAEFYFGLHDLPLGGDTSTEDFRTRAQMWTFLRHARTFIEGNLPFWDMNPADNLARNASGAFGGPQVYAKPGETYAVYLPNASNSVELDLQSFTQSFKLRWFNPRTGEFAGPLHTLRSGGGWRFLPPPPFESTEDWIALVRENDRLEVDPVQVSITGRQTQLLSIDAGPSFAGRDYVLLSSLTPLGGSFQLGGLQVPITFDRLTRFGIGDLAGTIYRNQFGVLDNDGRGIASMLVTPQNGAGLAGLTVHHCVVTRFPFDWVSNVVSVQITP